jgi:hypothetical protein
MLLCMNRIVFAIALLLACATMLGEPKDSRRAIPCKTPEIAQSCYWTHGRLGFYQGNPAFRVWKIGTKRVLGIFSGPSSYHGPIADTTPLDDNESPEFPANVRRTLKTHQESGLPLRIFADFEVCPLEPEKAGAMQAACIESAKNITTEK